jgi:phage gpG-like protein
VAKNTFNGLDKFVNTVRRAAAAGTLSVAKLGQNDLRDKGFSRTGRYTSSPQGTPPNIRRGFLRRSFQVRSGNNLSAIIWSDSRYALIHERGGTIRPKNVKHLTVPKNEAAQRFLETKGTNSLRNYDFMFFISKGKKFLVAQFGVTSGEYYTNAKGKRVRRISKYAPLIELKRSVNIPRRPYVRKMIRRIQGAPALRAFTFAANKVLESVYPGVRFL